MEIRHRDAGRLLDHINQLYSQEKLAGFSMAELRNHVLDNNILVSLGLEAEENRKHCERLEGLIEILKGVARGDFTPSQAGICVKQLREMLGRFSAKHSIIGYECHAELASSLGRGDLAEELQRLTAARTPTLHVLQMV
jgi:hypothetical protein